MTEIVVPPNGNRCAFCDKRRDSGPLLFVQCSCGSRTRACGACVVALLESKSSRATFDTWLITWAAKHTKCRRAR